MAWKYVMFSVVIPHAEVPSAGKIVELPVIFPPEISHKQIADGVQRGIGFDRFSRIDSRDVRPINAGFVSFNGVEREKAVSVWGDSESTGLKSDPRDAEIIHEVARRNPYFY